MHTSNRSTLTRRDLGKASLAALATGALGDRALMGLALAAYATYVVNATQFLLKLRAARLQGSAPPPLQRLSLGAAE